MNTMQNNLGEQVYVTAAYPKGLTLQEYHALTERQRRQHTWRPTVRGWPDRNRRETKLERWRFRAGD